MKTLDELYKEVMASDDLKKEFTVAALNEESLKAWLKKYDCGATLDELRTFLKEVGEGEIEDDEVESVAGGASGKTIASAVFYSVASFGIGCAAQAITSKQDFDSAKACFQDDTQNR